MKLGSFDDEDTMAKASDAFLKLLKLEAEGVRLRAAHRARQVWRQA